MPATNLAFWLVQLTKPFKSVIWDINPCLVGFNSTEREVFCRYGQLCERVEKRRFSNIRQPNLNTRINNHSTNNHKMHLALIIRLENHNLFPLDVNKERAKGKTNEALPRPVKKFLEPFLSSQMQPRLIQIKSNKITRTTILRREGYTNSLQSLS